MAGAVGVTIEVTRWLLIAVLVLLVPLTIYGLVAPDDLAAGIRANGGAEEIATQASTGAPFPMLLAAVRMGIAVFVLMMLRRVIATVSAGMPFHRRNVDRVRSIALALFGLALVPMLLPSLIPESVRTAMRIDLFEFSPGLWLGALVVLVRAEVFCEGVRLREDADMTV